MSVVMETTTPFVLEDVLITALTKVGAEPELVTSELMGTRQRNQLKIGDILTNRRDYNGRQLFRFAQNRWVLMHDSDEYVASSGNRFGDRRYTAVARFLADVGNEYNIAYQQYLEAQAEEERIRLEEERKQRVESIRQQAIAKARAQGYAVKEGFNSKGQIQLVLTRMV